MQYFTGTLHPLQLYYLGDGQADEDYNKPWAERHLWKLHIVAFEDEK